MGIGFIRDRSLLRILYNAKADIVNFVADLGNAEADIFGAGVAHAFLGVLAFRLWPLLIVIIIQSRSKNQLSCQIQIGKFDADPSEIKERKLATLSLFAEALVLYSEGKFAEAAWLFAECLRLSQSARVARIYWQRCQQNLERLGNN